MKAKIDWSIVLLLIFGIWIGAARHANANPIMWIDEEPRWVTKPTADGGGSLELGIVLEDGHRVFDGTLKPLPFGFEYTDVRLIYTFGETDFEEGEDGKGETINIKWAIERDFIHEIGVYENFSIISDVVVRRSLIGEDPPDGHAIILPLIEEITTHTIEPIFSKALAFDIGDAVPTGFRDFTVLSKEAEKFFSTTWSEIH